uniref:Uncharacterized protein n=1 Tax=Chrysotila carterae TaxID=13221 RepID=A0A7S4B7I9_CHRCT
MKLSHFLAHAFWQKDLRGHCGRRHELLQAIDLAVQDEPYRISFLARGAYIPIALKNYGFSVLSVPPRAFVTALVTVEVWNSASLVFLGHAAESVGDVMQTGSSGSGARVATLVVACAALLGLSAYGSVATRRALAKLRRQRDPADAVSLHAFQEKLVQ